MGTCFGKCLCVILEWGNGTAVLIGPKEVGHPRKLDIGSYFALDLFFETQICELQIPLDLNKAAIQCNTGSYKCPGMLQFFASIES